MDAAPSITLASGMHAEIRPDRWVPGAFELVVDGTAGTVVLGLVVNGPRAAPAPPRPRRQQEEHPS